jgi:hypothetical protein
MTPNPMTDDELQAMREEAARWRYVREFIEVGESETEDDDGQMRPSTYVNILKDDLEYELYSVMGDESATLESLIDAARSKKDAERLTGGTHIG